jgi:hypothetical protein
MLVVTDSCKRNVLIAYIPFMKSVTTSGFETTCCRFKVVGLIISGLARQSDRDIMQLSHRDNLCGLYAEQTATKGATLPSKPTAAL